MAKMGITEYNKQCRSIVMRYSKEWEVSICEILNLQDIKLRICPLNLLGGLSVNIYKMVENGITKMIR